MAIFTRSDIPPRSEITISYFGIASEGDDDDSDGQATNDEVEVGIYHIMELQVDDIAEMQMDEPEEENRCFCASSGCRGFIFKH